MSNEAIRNEIIRISQEALGLASQISSLWDNNISEYVESKLKQAA